jgi:hypothetical protein
MKKRPVSAFEALMQGAKKQKAHQDEDKMGVCPICNHSFRVKWMPAHVEQCLLAAQSGPSSPAVAGKNTSNNEKKGQEFVGEVYKINCLPIKGLYTIHEFLTVEEEEALLTYLDLTDENVCPPWKASKFNGQCLSKGWGVKTVHGTYINKRIGHVRKNDVAAGEPDLPASFDWLLDRIHNLWRSFEVEMRGKDNSSTRSNIVQEMKSLRINEGNANAYFKKEGHHLRPHVDDRFLSGPLLVNLSLSGRGTMRYQREKEVLEARCTELGAVQQGMVMHHTEAVDSIDVELPRRALQIVSGAARFDYEHSIPNNLLDERRRVSITLRMAGDRRKGVLGADQTELAGNMERFLDKEKDKDKDKE